MNPSKHIIRFWLLLVIVPINITAGIFDNLHPTLLATGMQLTESPTWHPDGYLVFSDITVNVIYKWSEQKELETLAANAGNPNGIMVTKKNDFVICRQGSRDIAKMDTLGKITSLLSTMVRYKIFYYTDKYHIK